MRISLIQNSPKLQKIDENTFASLLENVDTDIVVLPELALNGYMLKDAVFEDAYSIEEIEVFAKYSSDFDLVFGCVLQDSHKFYNAAVYCSKGKILHLHYKSVLPNYGLFQEARFFFSGESMVPFETKYGTLMLCICEEMFSAKIIEKIATNKPDLLVVMANSPSRGFHEEGLLIQNQWHSLLSTAAILSGAYVTFCNRVGFEDGLGFWGGSCVINPKGQIIAEAKLFEKDLLHVSLNHQLSKTQKYLLRIK